MAEFEPRPLHLHTLDSLIADLVSGRAVLVSENEFRLPNDRVRSALQWYRQRGEANWTANVSALHGEDLVDAVQGDPPNVPELPARAANANSRRLTLKKMKAHRFAGIHKFGTPAAAPPDYSYEFSAPLTLFEGRNGSGKTSLVNAITWALTGEILRPQRAPEAAAEEFTCRVAPASDTDEPTSHKLSPITPMPNVGSYRPEAPNIPLDTWVELTFEDETGEKITVRRTQSRSSRGALVETAQTRNALGELVETATDLSVLGIDPIACRIGTVMPGLLPVINVGQGSELGRAVAQLTGLASLVDLASHASRAKRKIDTDFIREKTTARNTADSVYATAMSDLELVMAAHPAIAPSVVIPAASDDTTIEQTLSQITIHFETLKATAFKSAQDILGQGFDPNDPRARADIEKNITLALDHVGRPQSLASFTRLRALGALTPAEILASEAKIAEILVEATTLQELARNPSEAARTRLYARVATWITDHPDPTRDDDHCAVCGGALDDTVDPVTGKSVKAHLLDAHSDAALVSQTLEQWAENALGALMRGLPEALRTELGADLPAHPCDLMRRAVVDELFELAPFAGVLGSLRTETAKAFDVIAAERADLEAASKIALPEGCTALGQALRRVDHAIRFAKWRRSNADLAKTVSETVLGRRPKEGEAAEEITLAGKLLSLDGTVHGAQPITDALVQCKRLKDQLALRRAAEKRLAEYALTSTALAHLVSMGDLAAKQVDQLQRTLRDDAASWRSRIYLGAFPDTAQELSATSSGPKGELELMVKAGGVEAPAQHVTNASALRANLVAFYLAFWEYVLKERGGITTLILDDPQELLDDENRERFAASFTHLIGAGACLITTSYDPRFAARVSRLTGVGGVDHQAIHPATTQQPMVRTTPPLKVLNERKERYENDKNAEEPAREYADGCRVFLEATLGDLFDEPAHFAWAQANPEPTFHAFVSRLRTQVAGAPQGMFSAHVFRRFVEHAGTADNSAVRMLMNKAHHGRRNEITAAEVAQCIEALGDLTEMAEEMYEECYRWRRRDAVSTAGQPMAVPAPLRPMDVPEFKVAICPDLAAFTSSAPIGESQQPAEQLDPNILQSKVVYFLRRDNFGFAAPQGALAIVEAVPGPVADRRLVIARRGTDIYARRFLKPIDGSIVGLTAESPDPRKKNSRTVFLPESEVELHQVVGVIFDHSVSGGVGKEEAVQIDATEIFEKIELTFRVSDTSAVPLALDKQVVLGGRYIEAADVGQHKDALVALTLDDGASLFKRVGDALPGDLAHVRQFESIGGLGASEVLAVGKDQPGFRRVHHARLIIGVLYHG